MIVDGRKIADDLYEKTRLQVQALSRSPVLTIIVCAPNFETKRYLALKEKKAEGVGIVTRLVELDAVSTTEDFITCIQNEVALSDGIIVQLPLPPHIDSDAVIKSVPVMHDVDGLNPDNTMLSPVVGAIHEILVRYQVSALEKFVTVIGSGRLVGLPAYQWFTACGAHVSVVTKDTKDIAFYTKNADIVVCGAGVSGLLKPDMVKGGVIILDAGTSEDGGELRGDADPACADKAELFTPVPGGIGPITVAILLRNVVDCASRKRPMV